MKRWKHDSQEIYTASESQQNFYLLKEKRIYQTNRILGFLNSVSVLQTCFKISKFNVFLGKGPLPLGFDSPFGFQLPYLYQAAKTSEIKGLDVCYIIQLLVVSGVFQGYTYWLS